MGKSALFQFPVDRGTVGKAQGNLGPPAVMGEIRPGKQHNLICFHHTAEINFHFRIGVSVDSP